MDACPDGSDEHRHQEKQDDMSLPHTFHCILFFIQFEPVPLIEQIHA